MDDPEWKVCEACDGTGYAHDECPTCERNGWVDDPKGGTMTCPDCGGDAAAYCGVCEGEGYVPVATE